MTYSTYRHIYYTVCYPTRSSTVQCNAFLPTIYVHSYRVVCSFERMNLHTNTMALHHLTQASQTVGWAGSAIVGLRGCAVWPNTCCSVVWCVTSSPSETCFSNFTELLLLVPWVAYRWHGCPMNSPNLTWLSLAFSIESVVQKVGRLIGLSRCLIMKCIDSITN